MSPDERIFRYECRADDIVLLAENPEHCAYHMAISRGRWERSYPSLANFVMLGWRRFYGERIAFRFARAWQRESMIAILFGDDRGDLG